MAFVAQSFNVGDILTASNMNTMDANIDIVRTQHKGPSAPVELAAGVLWLEDDNPSATVWTWQLYDGADQIKIGEFDSTNNKFTVAGIEGYYAKNLIINGGMQVAQRGNQTGQGASNAYTACDRYHFKVAGSASARWTTSQETGGGVNGESNWLKVLNTTSDDSPGATEAQAIYQKIETANMQKFIAADGSLAAVSVGIDMVFHADGASSISSPATITLPIRTQVTAGSAHYYMGEVTIAAADTWERVTINIAANVSAAFDRAMNSDSLWIGVGLYSGSTPKTPANAWTSGTNFFQTDDSDNLADATDNYIGFTLHQAELGATATPFEHEPISVTHAKCLRYYEKWINDQYWTMGIAHAGAANFGEFVAWFTEKRAAPTITVADINDHSINHAGGNVACTAFNAYYVDTTSSLLRFTIGSSPMTVDQCVDIRQDNINVGEVYFDSEL